MSGLMAHRGMILSGLRLSDGLYGFLPDFNAGATVLTYSNNDRTITPTTAANATRYSYLHPSLIAQAYFGVGTADNINTAWKGYIDDMRITRGVARPSHLPTEVMPVY